MKTAITNGRAIDVAAPGRPASPCYDAELVTQIERSGFHPFIMVRVVDGDATDIIVCPTQNDAAQFVQSLAELPLFSESRLLRGIERALQLEIYDAAELLLAWTQEPAATTTEWTYVGLPDGAALDYFYRYPAFHLARGGSRADPDQRIGQLEEAFHAYASTDGNEGLRVVLMEALAFALARSLGSRGRYAEAAAIVDRALAVRPSSIYLKAARHALGLRLEGKTVHPRLEEFIELLGTIERVGFHPFIMARVVDGDATDIVVCPTQNDAAQFVQRLAELPLFSESRLLRGIERALQLEIYDAAELLLAWTQEPAATTTEWTHVGLPAGAALDYYYRYPAFHLARGGSRADPDQRIGQLEEAFHAYASTDGNEGLRVVLMEALAFALSRSLGSRGRYAEAAAIVDRALAVRPNSIYLKAARHALGLRLEGKAVHPRLEEFIELLGTIERVGFHPFIMARVVDGDATDVIVCPTQNDAAQFVQSLAELPLFSESRLLRGIERALQLEIYDAAELLLAWTQESAATTTEWTYVGLPAGAALDYFYRYPAFHLARGGSRADPDQRIGQLEEAFHAYASTDGNEGLRVVLMEALAFALARSLGSRGRYAEAAAIVDRALAVRPSSIYLKAARHALGLRLDGKTVHPRLEKFIGRDSGYLKRYVCPLPFERFDIGPDGNVLVCCGHWLPTAIGNFMKEEVDAVLNSASAMKIRESVTDGSYKYCNHLECGAMAQDTLPTIDELRRPRTRAAVASGNFRLDRATEVMFSFDQTCNLSCPSCRTSRIVEKVSESLDKARAVEEKLLPLLPRIEILHINPAGELFASKPSRRLLELIDDRRCPNLRLDIISNGTLLDEQEWNKFPGIHGKVRAVRISIDAACKETFEKLRRLGRYDDFIANMRFLRHLRSTGQIGLLKFSFTYQLDNFREMPAFVDFCGEMGADFAIFERLQNIAFSDAEFRRKAVHYPDHPLYPEFIEIIRGPIFRAARVWHDFDYPDVENMSREDALRRMTRGRSAALVASAGASSR